MGTGEYRLFVWVQSKAVIDMDRYDDLLLKARAEMVGKHAFRKAPTTNELFESVWEGVVKNYDWTAELLEGYKQEREGQAAPPASPQGMGAQFSAARETARNKGKAPMRPETGRSPSGTPWAPPTAPRGGPLPPTHPRNQAGAQTPPSIQQPPVSDWQQRLKDNAAGTPSIRPGQSPTSPMTQDRANQVLEGWNSPTQMSHQPSDTPAPSMSVGEAQRVLSGEGSTGAQAPPTMTQGQQGAGGSTGGRQTSVEQWLRANPGNELETMDLKNPKNLEDWVMNNPDIVSEWGYQQNTPATQSPAGLLPAPGETSQGQAPPGPKAPKGLVEQINRRKPEDKAEQHPAEKRTKAGNLSQAKGAKESREQRRLDYGGEPKEEAPPPKKEAPSPKSDASEESAQERRGNRANNPAFAANRPPAQEGGENLFDNDKKASHERAEQEAWSILKNPFANPLYDPTAFALNPNFKAQEREPVHSFDSVLTAQTVPDESLELHKKLASMGVRADDDLSLLPRGMLQTSVPQEAHTDMSLLPRGWAEGDSA